MRALLVFGNCAEWCGWGTARIQGCAAAETDHRSANDTGRETEYGSWQKKKMCLLSACICGPAGAKVSIMLTFKTVVLFSVLLIA